MTGDLIDDYLARLRAGLRTPPARTAEIVAEAEDHLRESAAARRADGLDEAAAQRAAIAAFGPVRQVTSAHRPTLSAYAAAAAVRAWPLLGCYLLLSALLGGVVIWEEMARFRGQIMAAVSWGGTRTMTYFMPSARPDPVELAAILGAPALAGLAVIAGFRAVRRRGRLGVASVPLPPGLFPLAAGIALLGFAIAQIQGARSYGYGWLPRVPGLYELTAGGALAGAALLGICCVLRALVTMAEVAVRPREPAVAGLGAVLSGPPLAGETLLEEDTVLPLEPALAGLTGSAPRAAAAAHGLMRLAVRDRLIRAPGYAADAGLRAAQWLGSFLVLAALIAGVLLYLENRGPVSAWRYLPEWEAACAGYGLAGALLFAVVARARHRREANQARVTLPRWLAPPATAAWLALIAVTEYNIIAGNANGRLATAELGRAAWEGLYWVVVGAQFAAMIMGAACLGRWILAGWRAAGRDSPPA